MSRRKVKRTRYFVWFAEYPDEGSEIVCAKTKREALRRGSRLFSAPQSHLDAVKATAVQLKAWRAVE